MFEWFDHEYGLYTGAVPLLSWQGPFSASSQITELQHGHLGELGSDLPIKAARSESLPGPPVSQSVVGASAGFSLASRNQKNMCVLGSKSMYPE